jgi:bla regulator protein BlaR1
VTRQIARRLTLSLIAIGTITMAMPVAYGQNDAPLPTRPAPIPQWQTAASGTMSFDVASIRSTRPGQSTDSNFALDFSDSYAPYGDPKGILKADLPLSAYILFAYKLWLTPEQIKSMLADLPKWVATDDFHIEARAEGDPTKDQMRLMMQSLLADRFGLKIHTETQPAQVLALTLVKTGKTGPKLRPHADGPPCDVVTPSPAKGAPSANADVFPPTCDSYLLQRSKTTHVSHFGARNTTMPMIAHSLAMIGQLGRPVIDQTGLSGSYDFSIEWTPEPNATTPTGLNAQPEPPETTFLEAVKEQLGLKLEPTKVPLDVLVVDHIERPSEN